jgi:hypothetical protein
VTPLTRKDLRPTDAYAQSFHRDGYHVREGVLSGDEVELLRAAVAAIRQGEEVRRRPSVYGIRNLLKICPAVRQLAAQPPIRQFVTPILTDAAFAVRAIFFDKAPGGNWSLHWHQDNVIAVAERREVPSFVGWSNKAGVWHVQPPAEVLAKMLAVRVHLDDSTLLNGPLRVLPGSHRHGWVDNVDEWKRNVPEVVCTVPCGGVVVMCPLTLHASAASEATDNRRVIHIEYAVGELPHGLAWSDRVAPSLE